MIKEISIKFQKAISLEVVIVKNFSKFTHLKIWGHKI